MLEMKGIIRRVRVDSDRSCAHFLSCVSIRIGDCLVIGLSFIMIAMHAPFNAWRLFADFDHEISDHFLSVKIRQIPSRRSGAKFNEIEQVRDGGANEPKWL